MATTALSNLRFELISTASVPPKDRFPLWRDAMWNLFDHLESTTETDRPFAGRMQFGKVADTILCKTVSSSHILKRTAPFSQFDGLDYVKVLLQIGGETSIEQNGRSARFLPREWGIYDLARPYKVWHSDDTKLVFLTIPRQKLSNGPYNLDDLMLHRFPSTNGVEKLVYRFGQDIFEEIPALGIDSLCTMVDMAAQLMRLSMAALYGKRIPTPSTQILRDRAKSFVESNLHDSELHVEQIAAALMCSKRYLHKAFELEGLSISTYIWQRRLEHCSQCLIDPAFGGRTITEIAFHWGFNSSAHFSSAFRKRFGVSAREYQRLFSPNVLSSTFD